MTRGTRYAVLPCLYDDAAAAVRQANLASVVPPAPPPLAGAIAQR